MTSQLRFEDFTNSTETGAEIGPSKEYLAGFEDGVRAGQHAAEKQQQNLNKALVTHIRNTELTRAELRQELLQAMAPVIEQLANAVLPALASESFVHHLSQEIRTALEGATNVPLTLAVHPDQFEAVNLALGTAEVGVSEDSDLSPDQARLSLESCETLVDLPALIRQLQNALAGLFPDERTKTHV